MWYLFLILIIISLIIGFNTYDGEGNGWAVFFIGCLVLIIGKQVYNRYDPEWIAENAAEERARYEERVRQETPHVVREADGCKVYAFKSGDRWHFFTRCPNSTTNTDTAYEVCTGSGKTRSCKEEHSSIQTVTK